MEENERGINTTDTLNVFYLSCFNNAFYLPCTLYLAFAFSLIETLFLYITYIIAGIALRTKRCVIIQENGSNSTAFFCF